MFNLRLPPSLSMQTVKSHLPSDFFTQPAPPSTTPASCIENDVALALALAGWQGLTNSRIGPVPNTASCATCLRRLGLWMFKSREVDQETGEILVSAPMDHLDPIREHRFFCPWRNAAAQRNPGSKVAETENKTAWEVLALTIRNASYLRGNRNRSPKGSPALERSKSTTNPSTPVRPSRHVAAASHGGPSMPSPDLVDEEIEEEAAAENKERWARLRRVTSIFDTKNARKLRRTLSRPGTAAANSPDTAHSSGQAGAV
jgi:hypothetical protein